MVAPATKTTKIRMTEKVVEKEVPADSKVRVKVVRPFILGEGKEAKIVSPGEEVTVSAEEAQRLTTPIRGPFNFSGLRTYQQDDKIRDAEKKTRLEWQEANFNRDRHQIVYAEVVSFA